MVKVFFFGVFLVFSILGCVKLQKPDKSRSTQCKVDADCVIDCSEDHECCGSLCQCQRAVNQDYRIKIVPYCESKRKKNQWECPVAKCPSSPVIYKAYCKASLCVAVAEKRK